MIKVDGKGIFVMTGTIAVIMVFSIPIIAMVTNHFQKQAKIKRDMLKDQLELEKLKHENYLIETEKMRLQLERMSKDQTIEDNFKS
jgi:hypothetical protein